MSCKLPIRLTTHCGRCSILPNRKPTDSSNKIAEEMQIFTFRINSQLVNALDPPGGARGGVMLAKPAADISACDVVTTIDGPITLIDCIADPESARSPDCPYRTFGKKPKSSHCQDESGQLAGYGSKLKRLAYRLEPTNELSAIASFMLNTI